MSSNKLSKRLEENEKKANKELFELKRENMQLRRAVARLQKQIAKLLENWGSSPAENEEEKAASPLVKEKKENECPSCSQSTLKILSLGLKKIAVCGNCRYRGLINDKE